MSEGTLTGMMELLIAEREAHGTTARELRKAEAARDAWERVARRLCRDLYDAGCSLKEQEKILADLRKEAAHG